ncbi:hypothetical protein VTN31DRAFT_1815 [Thermomyces dupontii]|uniref:uncharacterized protein n=1 Tax=Talaromyces thermophilus TaxID=28565 RepID=UPI003743F484
MSDLQKSFMKKKFTPYHPAQAPVLEERAEDAAATTMNEGEDDSSDQSSTGTVVPSATENLWAKRNLTRRPGQSRNGATDALDWSEFFSQEITVEQEAGDLRIAHHAYITPPGTSGSGSSPLFVMHHGAGSSGLSFAAVAREIRELLPNAGILSLDARHHGDTRVTKTSSSAAAEAIELDLRLETLSRDMVHVIRQVQVQMGWKELPDLVLVGHSLGGAVVTDVAKGGKLGSKVLAYAVLDVVEGSAMNALRSMDTYLSTRPTRFASVQDAIEWHVRSRTIRNSASARISVPSLIRRESDPADPERPWVWKTNLADTKPFWENWFVGLSKKFLEARGGKLLLLAGTDRLDTELTIGQMQGKYQLQIFPLSGHFIQEDMPSQTAQVLVDFFSRNDRGALVLPPKVADLKATQAMEKGAGSGLKS